MGSIKFVIGPAGSGKSTFIQCAFPQYSVVDLFDFQKQIDTPCYSVDAIENSYLQTRDALASAVQSGKNVVLEHTLLRAIRRPMYVEAVRSFTDEPIDIYVMQPTREDFARFRKQRQLPPGDEEMAFLERPDKTEGFRAVYLVRPIVMLEDIPKDAACLLRPTISKYSIFQL